MIPPEHGSTDLIDFNAALTWLNDEPERLILCVNSALQRELLRQQMTTGGVTTTPVDRILNLDSLMMSIARESARSKGLRLASSPQLQLAWRRFIDRQSETFTDHELDPISLAGEAMQAHDQLIFWQVAGDRLAEAELFSEIRFGRWCLQFEEQLVARGLTTSAMMLRDLCAFPSPVQSALLVTAGGELAPLTRQILGKRYKWIESRQIVANQANCWRYEVETPADEARAAGLWAAQLWRENPARRIAIINTDRQLTAAALKREIQRFQHVDVPIRFNFAHPATHGAIYSGLELLQLNRAKISRQKARQLTTNRFWSAIDDEILVRANWERGICRLQSHELSFRQLATELTQAQHSLENPDAIKAGEKLIGQFEHFSRCRRDNPATASLTEWALIFSQQLAVLGWPGKTLDSEGELSRWDDLCLEFSALDAVLPPCGLHTALNLLAEQICQLKFPPDRTTNGINLLDTLESAIGFDAIWLMGADHQKWPAPAQGNSLIPRPVQAEFNLPRHSADQEYSLCRQLFGHLRQNTRQLVFSISCPDPDQSPGFSALVPDCPALELPENTGEETISSPSQWVDCRSAPAYSPGETPVRGGSNLLDLMLGSPFVAFARWRLAAQELDQPSDGWDAMRRGSLVHAALETIWQELKDQRSLQQSGNDRLEKLIASSIDQAIARLARQNSAPSPALEAGLRSWLGRLLETWLTLEAKRPAFEVEAVEQLKEVQVGPLRLRLKLDRIDRFADKRLMVIDYKTGSTQLSQLGLMDSPPASAQLPLYAMALDQAPDAVSLASVVPDKPGIQGIGQGLMHPGVKEVDDWNALIQQWRADLEEVARSFVAGNTEHWCRELPHGRKDSLASLHRQAERDELVEKFGDC